MCNNGVRRASPPPDAVYVDPVPRRRRAFTEGIYHVGSHGSDDRALFRTEDDGVDFLERLAIVCREYELDLRPRLRRDHGRRGADRRARILR